MTTPTIWQVRKWIETFEDPAVARWPKGPMTFYAHPVNLSSRGRLRLLRRGPDGIMAVTVFESIVQLLAAKPASERDGRLVGSNGAPLDVQDISEAIGISGDIVDTSLGLLQDPSVGWLVPWTAEEASARRQGSRRVRKERDATTPDPEVAIWRRLTTETGFAHLGFRQHPSGRLPKDVTSDINARRRDYRTEGEFLAALEDRIRRVRSAPSHNGVSPPHGGTWKADLTWILTRKGWQSSKRLQLPSEREAAKRPGRFDWGDVS